MMFTIENNSKWNGKIQCSLGCFPASSYCPVSPLTLGLPPSPHVVITTEKTQRKHEPVNILWPQCRSLWLELVWGRSDGGLAKAGTQPNNRSRSSAVPKITTRQNRMKYARINGATSQKNNKNNLPFPSWNEGEINKCGRKCRLSGRRENYCIVKSLRTSAAWKSCESFWG